MHDTPTPLTVIDLEVAGRQAERTYAGERECKFTLSALMREPIQRTSLARRNR